MKTITSPEARKRMIALRATLLLDEPYWGSLVLRLVLLEDRSCKTAWTDGTSLGYNPEFVLGLTHAELLALWAHEVSHCTHGHPWRRSGRDAEQWNEAADRVINPLLRDSGFKLPKGVLFELEPTHKGKSAEWVYDRLPRNPTNSAGGEEGPAGGQGPGKDEDGKPTPGTGDRDETNTEGSGNPLGDVRDAPTEAEAAETPAQTEAGWQQAVRQAVALAEGRGSVPAGMYRLTELAVKERIDWKPILWRFAQEVAQSDYTWTRPNRAHTPRGMYLPSMYSHSFGAMVIGVDTSGSIDNILLQQFGREIQAIIDQVQPRQVHVWYCDAAISHRDVFERGEPVSFAPHGGGGTDFRPVFDALEGLDAPPACVIYLTDLAGSFPEKDPGVPTLWVTGREGPAAVPFGEVVTAT